MKKKSRPEAKLLHLTEEQTALLSDWLRSRMSEHQVVALVEKEFGIKTSQAAVSRFYSSVVSDSVLAQRMRAVKLSNELVENIKAQPGQWDDLLLNQIGQRAFEINLDPEAKAGDLSKLMNLVLRGRQQEISKQGLELKERQIAVLEKQASQAKATLSDSTLTPEERQRRVKEIFGLT